MLHYSPPSQNPQAGSTMISTNGYVPAKASVSAETLLPLVRELLTPKLLDKSPVAVAESLIAQLHASGDVTEIDRETRLEVLVKMRDGAGLEFYTAWAKSARAMDLVQKWLKSALKGPDFADTLMPLLHVSFAKPCSQRGCPKKVCS
jgi:hypothetical protein